jgi:bifunctional NMN adenylyltransferase/nudix hydrolase
MPCAPSAEQAMAQDHALAVVHGRFQPPQNSDIAALRHALQRADRCLLLLAGAYAPRSPRNLLGWEERAGLIRHALPEAGDRLLIEPMRDWYDAHRTAQEVESLAVRQLPQPGAPLLRIDTGEPATCGAEGLHALPWRCERMPAAGAAPAQQLRDHLFGCDDPQVALEQMAEHLPPPVLAWLYEWVRGPRYALLREEWHQLAHEKAQWSAAPYPVVLVTVDAVVLAAGQVLLVRRGRQPGKGLWALPGGFVEPRETLHRSAVRELVEETGLPLDEAELGTALRAVQVFDHPDRSQRGRVITHAHLFDLGEQPPPAVHGGDDAADAQWVALQDLSAMEAQFLDDHWLVLDRFLGLSGPRP